MYSYYTKQVGHSVEIMPTIVIINNRVKKKQMSFFKWKTIWKKNLGKDWKRDGY